MPLGWEDDTTDPLATGAGVNGFSWLSGAKLGINAIAGRYSGSADPAERVDAGEIWATLQIGRLWEDLDHASLGDFYPMTKSWEKLTTTPTYDWRTLRLKKILQLGTHKLITPGGAARVDTVDVVETTLDLTSDLDAAGVQDTGEVAHGVVSVGIFIVAKPTAIAPTDGEHRITIGGNGNDKFYLQAQVLNITNSAYFQIPIDNAEVMTYKVDVPASGSITWDMWIVDLYESV